MPEELNLEYTCTAAEKSEAEELDIRRQLGRGSKWRTNAILYGMVATMFLAFYLEIRREFSVAYLPYAFAAIVVLIAVILFWRARLRRTTSRVTRLQISDKEISIRDSNTSATMPWSAFSQCLESQNLFVLLDRPKVTLLVLPKRVFPDQGCQAWFRDRVANQIADGESTANSPAVTMPATAGDVIAISFRLRFWDYLEHALFSRQTWLKIAAIQGIILATFIYTIANPPPRAIYSPAQVFLGSLLPVLLLIVIMGVLIPCAYAWYVERKHLIPQSVALSDNGIRWVSSNEDTELKWTALTYFRETRWSFIVWASRESALMLPKRAFASADDIQRCSALLGRHLQRSRWFSG